jgi:FkbM family methyltransferase
MRQLLSPGDTFIDAGANHGSYSLKAARLVGEKGKVLAFEPQPRLASLIRKSFAANGYSNAEVYEVACSNHSGVTEFYLPESGSGTAGIHKAFSGKNAHQKIVVKMDKFDELIKWPKLPGRVFVKLDVEGSELAFLRGAEQMIRSRKPFLLLEVNPTSTQASGSSGEQILSFLISLGYEKYSEVDSYPEVMSLLQSDITKQRNILVIP